MCAPNPLRAMSGHQIGQFSIKCQSLKYFAETKFFEKTDETITLQDQHAIRFEKYLGVGRFGNQYTIPIDGDKRSTDEIKILASCNPPNVIVIRGETQLDGIWIIGRCGQTWNWWQPTRFPTTPPVEGSHENPLTTGQWICRQIDAVVSCKDGRLPASHPSS